MEPDERPNLELLLHAERWGSALDDPDCLLELVEADVQAGFAEWIPGGVPEAKERYGDLCAAARVQSGMPSLWTLPKPTNASAFATQKEVCLFSQLVDRSGATRWLVYHTTHFGCAWAAYWWARTAAAFVRALQNHFAAVYVDDLLALFLRQASQRSRPVWEQLLSLCHSIS